MNDRNQPFPAHVHERIFIFQGKGYILDEKIFHIFKIQNLEYFPFCDDFGPMNMGCVIRFMEQLDQELALFPEHKVVLYVESGKREFTNAVFLLGSYCIIKLNFTLQKVLEKFSWLDSSFVQPFRDATYSQPDFGLSLADCWAGLEKGKCQGWIAGPTEDEPTIFGQISIEEYEQYDDPLNGDLHEVVPGKFVAFKGPRDLGGRQYLDERSGHRNFSPGYYLSIFRELEVVTVVRLNEPEYDPQMAYEQHGIRTVELEFQDCTAPPNSVASAFLAAADSAHARGGSVAVHCHAGLGRTGTLIGLWLMRRLGFSAREAMGWLRIMRPGSVIGEQQHYLCAAEQALRTPPLRPLRLSGPRGSGSARRAVEAVAAATAAALSTADEECSAPSSPGDRPRRLPTLQLSPAPSHADAPAGCTSVTACSAGDRDPLPKEKVSGAGVASSLRLGQASILRSLTINGGAPRRLGVLSAAAAAAAAADGDDSRGPRSLAQALAAQVSAGLECRSAARARRGSVQ